MLGFGLPVQAVVAQHGQLTAARSRLQRLQAENQALRTEQRQLASKAGIEHLARQDFQLVTPGQTLYNVLPPAGNAPAGTADGPTGDPGNQAPVAPGDAPNLRPQSGLPTAPSVSGANGGSGAGSPGGGQSSSGGTGAQAGSGGGGQSSRPKSFWRRVVNTLEFWR